jgi:hypothetical protein
MGVKIRLVPKGKSTHRLKVFENKKVLRRPLEYGDIN